MPLCVNNLFKAVDSSPTLLEAGRGSVISLIGDGNRLIGIGTNKKSLGTNNVVMKCDHDEAKKLS